MKTLFRTFGFPLLALIAVIVVLAIRGLAQPTTTPSATRCPDPQDMLVNVKIGKPSGPGYTCKPDDTFVKLKDPNQDPAVKGGLNDQLDALYSGGGQYKICFKDKDNKIHDCHHAHGSLSGSVNIKTDRITTSEVARRAQVQGSAANDPNVTWRISSNSPADVANVLNTLTYP